MVKTDVRKMAEEIFQTEKEYQRRQMKKEFSEAVWDDNGTLANLTISEIEGVLCMLSRHWGRIPAKRVPDAIQLITMIAENKNATRHPES